MASCIVVDYWRLLQQCLHVGKVGQASRKRVEIPWPILIDTWVVFSGVPKSGKSNEPASDGGARQLTLLATRMNRRSDNLCTVPVRGDGRVYRTFPAVATRPAEATSGTYSALDGDGRAILRAVDA